ncbi:hypothetical protein BVI1335_1250007 [Burkholderia vietnamiensis]|nr:hypothetical protein BVI1335_1250007 [Burkholderia vietnamiensis]
MVTPLLAYQTHRLLADFSCKLPWLLVHGSISLKGSRLHKIQRSSHGISYSGDERGRRFGHGQVVQRRLWCVPVREAIVGRLTWTYFELLKRHFTIGLSKAVPMANLRLRTMHGRDPEVDPPR